ncbi:MAG: hypothetical protein QOD61_722, partial [Solirubrobacteraceae bacterium]|nr:hypothetical protein [Solirubrobacteraceae bacterium]
MSGARPWSATMPARKNPIPVALALAAALAAAAVLSTGAQAGRPAAGGSAHASQAAPGVSGTIFNDANAN